MRGGIFIERFIFTYADYLEYSKEITYEEEVEEKIICVQDETVEYIYENVEIEKKVEEKKTGDKKHDKIFKEILQNKREMADFLKQFIEYEIKAEELENYNPNYITKNFKYQQSDIVYKVKGKQVYILVEHQTKVDYSMSYRNLNYCIEIIRGAVEEKETSKSSYKYPIVIPIVLYTGSQKWTAKLSFAKNQVEDENMKEKVIDIKYKLIDVNKYKVEELLNMQTMLSSIMILEKCKNNEEVVNNLNGIIKNLKDNEQKEKLKRIVMYLYEDIEESKLKEILKMIEESESEENMSTIRERLREEYINERKQGIAIGMSQGIAQGIAQGMTQGIAQNIAQTIERMIKMNFKDETIEEATGAEKKEIERIRKEVMKL